MLYRLCFGERHSMGIVIGEGKREGIELIEKSLVFEG